MLSHELEFTLNQAFKQAKQNRHEYMTVEHLLLLLIDSPSAGHGCYEPVVPTLIR